MIFVPGRVNLIGGHVDFHEGPVVCAAVDRGITGRVARRDDGRAVVTSASFPGTVAVDADGGADPPAVEPSWGRLVAGVLHELSLLGRPPVGFDLDVTSTLTVGGGLSSSAAFEVLVGRAAASVVDWDIDPLDLAVAAQAAEVNATGVPCGVQDQVAASLGGTMLLDCRDLSVRRLAVPEEASVMVFDSGVRRTLDGSPWGSRRAESFAAAEALGVRVLRDVPPGTALVDPRARHVVEEIARVWDFARCLEAGELGDAGRLMLESHRSSRDLWESSTPELDRLVDQAMAAGAWGARLTGGGFGGCVVAIVPTELRAGFPLSPVAQVD